MNSFVFGFVFCVVFLCFALLCFAFFLSCASSSSSALLSDVNYSSAVNCAKSVSTRTCY